MQGRGKGVPKSAEHRAKIGAAQKGRKNPNNATPEARAKNRAGVIASMERRAKDGTRFKHTTIERTVMALLDAIQVPYEAQKVLRGLVVDIYVPEKNLVIECDGTYWHSRPGRAENDARRDAKLTAAGYRILRLPEHEIESGAARYTVLEAVL